MVGLEPIIVNHLRIVLHHFQAGVPEYSLQV